MSSDGVIYKRPIRGIFKRKFYFIEYVYKIAEAGEILVTDSHIKLRMGPHHYIIDNIEKAEIKKAKSFQFEESIELTYKVSGQVKILYLFDFKYLGFKSLTSSAGIKEILYQLKKFQDKHSL